MCLFEYCVFCLWELCSMCAVSAVFFECTVSTVFFVCEYCVFDCVCVGMGVCGARLKPLYLLSQTLNSCSQCKLPKHWMVWYFWKKNVFKFCEGWRLFYFFFSLTLTFTAMPKMWHCVIIKKKIPNYNYLINMLGVYNYGVWTINLSILTEWTIVY